MNVRIIDGYIVDAIESLRAEWLYSQGRGRHFRVGDQHDLSQYLATVCPLTGETLETEEDRKLRIILSKAQHHQQQLRDQETNPEACTPSPITRKKMQLMKSSPRIQSSRLSNRSKSPERMSSSCYSNSSIINSPLMSQSLDPTILSQSITPKSSDYTMNDQHQNGISEKCLDDVSSPLQALSKLVPVPESLMSPDYRPSPLINRMITPSAISTPSSQRISSAKVVAPVRSPKPSRIATVKSKTGIDNKKNNQSPSQQRKATQNMPVENVEKLTITSLPTAMKKSPSSEDESEICPSKLQTIQMKAEERRQQKDIELHSNSSSSEDKIEQAAVYIQKMWRGYHTRNKNKHVQELFRNLQAQRAEQYIQKLATDMESTKVALESERRIQMLQMQAINALWKKVSALQPDGENSGISTLNSSSATLDNTEVVKDLAQTCNMLHSQIQQLQGSMQDIVRFMTIFSQVPTINQQLKENAIATQTEISAVHTPQGEAAKLFPFQKQTRPSSLPLPVSQRVNKHQNSIGVACVANQELKQYAGSLVDGVIKTVSETQADCIGGQVTEITVTNMDRMVELEKLETINSLENSMDEN